MSLQTILRRAIPASHLAAVEYYVQKVSGTMEFELAHLRMLTRGGGNAIDVGANNGVYTYAFSRLFDRVFAFEPQPRCHASLRGIKAGNVTVHAMAVGADRGHASLQIPIRASKTVHQMASLRQACLDAESYATLDVEVRPLDSFGFENVSLIKIDVEGFEEPVLRGATNLIADSKPMIIIELEERHLGAGGVETAFAQLESLGYRGTFFMKGEEYSTDCFLAGTHQLPFTSRNKPAGYINNFVFRWAGDAANVRRRT